jgi:hypothetical protein
MGSDLDFILPLRDRVRRGELIGPDIVAAGPMLDNAPPDWPFRRRVANAQEAREGVSAPRPCASCVTSVFRDA